MSDTRFTWSRATELEGAFELKSRNVRKHLLADSSLRCWIKACRARFHKGDEVYYPTKAVNTSNNKVLAHANCIDTYCESHAAKSAVETRMKDAERKGLLPLAAASAASVNAKYAKKPMPKLGAEIVDQLSKIKRKYYQEGWDACYAAIMASLDSEDENQSGFSH